MPREIKSANQQLQIQNVAPNDFKDRLIKLIPAEIIAAYVTISGLIIGFAKNNPNADKSYLLWIVILVLMIFTPVYLMKILGVSKKVQILFSTIGFLIWAFATASPYTKDILGFSFELIASLILILYTLLIPLFYKG
ncbi:hypothetical protein [Flavobacterium sp. MDT1-60]|uniref:hypothetical protein n=1 Tax=Flavobacterium sp. MDT1-60 TaxID=1979344 RepID=UPI00178741A6|nr:hypothetical protein [Flavobacterium sp. MDT1-60]QOG01178.1 hypothetical protein IHE43_15305 [Flavobacterium sp. MDT1-60]